MQRAQLLGRKLHLSEVLQVTFGRLWAALLAAGLPSTPDRAEGTRRVLGLRAVELSLSFWGSQPSLAAEMPSQGCPCSLT